jgi:D-2-hydroxyacid dehydrogenase (NADP+)
MSTVVVRHDLDIAPAITERRDDIDIVVAADRAEALEALPDADVFAINPSNWDDAYLEGLDAGDWVQATSIGYDAFPIEAFRDRGVRFTNASGNYGPVVAEHVFAMAFAYSRHLHQFRSMQRAHEWDRSIGLELSDWLDSTMTVLGLGNLGEVIAERGRGFEFDVYGVKRDLEDYDGVLAGDRLLGSTDWHRVLPDTDLLVAAVPLTEDTEAMVDANVLRALPDDAFLVNVARGPVVDETALLEALEGGQIAGAGLDVFETEPLPPDSPLWDREDVIITPHVAGRSDGFADRYAELFVDNYDRRERGEPMRNRIV